MSENQNLRLRLTDLMQDISETHIFMSWPIGWEHKIWRWLDGDNSAEPPFDDRKGIVTPALWGELKSLRNKLAGWLYYDETASTIRFVPKVEWLEIVERREAEDARTKALDSPHRYADFEAWFERKKSKK